MLGSAQAPTPTLGDLFGAAGAAAAGTTLSSLLGGSSRDVLQPTLNELFGGLNPGAPSTAAGFAEIKAGRKAKAGALGPPPRRAG